MLTTNRFGTVLGIVTLCGVCLLRTDTMAQQPNASPATSGEMTLSEIADALDAYPPNWDHAQERCDIFSSLDRLIDIRVNESVGMSDEDRARLKPLLAFYRARVDHGLDRLEATTVTEGVHVFKFYSSSYVLRSAEGTVAIDFCQGPVSSRDGDPETEDELDCGFYWTPEQRARLADQVDVSLITHRHHDHCDFSLSRLLLEQGKTVVGPSQVCEQWKDLLPGMTAAEYGQVQQFGPVEILTTRGCQFSKNVEAADGSRQGVVNEEHPTYDNESVVYLVKIGDAILLQAAENHIPYEAFLRRAQENGWAPNVALSIGQWQGGASVAELLSGVFRLSVHEYEMTHGGGGNRMAYRLEGGNRERYLERRQLPLVWGEDALLTREVLGR